MNAEIELKTHKQWKLLKKVLSQKNKREKRLQLNGSGFLCKINPMNGIYWQSQKKELSTSMMRDSLKAFFLLICWQQRSLQKSAGREKIVQLILPHFEWCFFAISTMNFCFSRELCHKKKSKVTISFKLNNIHNTPLFFLLNFCLTRVKT